MGGTVDRIDGFTDTVTGVGLVGRVLHAVFSSADYVHAIRADVCSVRSK